MMLWTCGRSSIHYDGVVRREVRLQLHAMDLIRRCIFQEPVSGMLQHAAFLEPITCTIHQMIHTALASVSYSGFGEQANAVLQAGSSLLFQLL